MFLYNRCEKLSNCLRENQTVKKKLESLHRAAEKENNKHANNCAVNLFLCPFYETENYILSKGLIFYLVPESRKVLDFATATISGVPQF